MTKTTKHPNRRNAKKQAELEAKLGPQPKCANKGCGKPVAYTGGDRWKHFCSHCIKVGQNTAKPKPHITYLRKFQCDNKDGKLLGFSCYTDWKKVKKDGIKITTHMDHVDGNHKNSTAKNLQELCP